MNGQCWEQVKVNQFDGSPPSQRSLHVAVVHQQAMYVFGGYTGQKRVNSMHRFDFLSSTWRCLDGAEGVPPGARDRHTGVVVHDLMLVFGGYDGFMRCSDTHAFGLSTSQWLPVQLERSVAPSPRHSHSACAFGDCMYVTCGYDGSYRNDLFEFTLLEQGARGVRGSWRKVAAKGRSPQARYRATVCAHLDQHQSRQSAKLVLFGGHNGSVHLQCTHIFDVASEHWSSVRTTGAVPLPRDSHSAVMYQDLMLTFGGSCGQPLNDFSCLSMADLVWRPVGSDSWTPCARFCASAALYDGSFYLFGGYDSTDRLRDIHRFKFAPSVCSVQRSSLIDDLASNVADDSLSDLVFRLVPGNGDPPGNGGMIGMGMIGMGKGTGGSMAAAGAHAYAQAHAQARAQAQAQAGQAQGLGLGQGQGQGQFYGGNSDSAIGAGTGAGAGAGTVGAGAGTTVGAYLGGATVPAHRIFCMRCSSLLRLPPSAASPDAQGRVVVDVAPGAGGEPVDAAVFRLFLSYLYTDRVHLRGTELALDLYALAVRYEVHRLCKICLNFVSLTLTVFNAAGVFQAADRHGIKELRERALAFIVTRFDQVSRTESFEEMGRTDVELVFEVLRGRGEERSEAVPETSLAHAAGARRPSDADADAATFVVGAGSAASSPLLLMQQQQLQLQSEAQASAAMYANINDHSAFAEKPRQWVPVHVAEPRRMRGDGGQRGASAGGGPASRGASPSSTSSSSPSSSSGIGGIGGIEGIEGVAVGASRGGEGASQVHTSPGKRSLHDMAVYGDNILLFGGYNGERRVNDFFRFSLKDREWSKVRERQGAPGMAGLHVGPSARDRHTVVVVGRMMWVFGGYNGTARVNELHGFDMERELWTQVPASPQTPSARHSHSACGVAAKGSMYIFGGYDGSYLNDLHVFDATATATATAAAAATAGDSAAAALAGPPTSAAATGTAGAGAEAAVVAGGGGGGSRWRLLAAKGKAPNPRYRATLVSLGSHLVCAMGHDGYRHLSDVYTYSLAGQEWAALRATGPSPAPRDSHTACVLGTNQMVIFGGSSGSSLNCMYKLRFHKDTGAGVWTRVSCTGMLPSARFCHSTVMVYKTMYTYGGYDGSHRLDDWIEFSFGESRVSHVPRSTIVSDLALLVDNPTCSDVTFVVEGRRVAAHKVMCTRCHYFKAMFGGGRSGGGAAAAGLAFRESSQSEICIPDIGYDVFYTLLKYLYTDRQDVPLDMAMELFVAADRFGVERLKNMCENKMLSSVDCDNVSDLFVAAELHSAHSLYERCLKYITTNFDVVSKTPQFERMGRANIDLIFTVLNHR